MIGRALLWVLEVGWMAAWALHFGAGWDVAVMPLAAIAAEQARTRRAWAVPVWILGAAAAAVTGGWWGVLLVLAAMWRGASPPRRDQPAVYERMAIAIIGAAPLAVVAAGWAWTLPAAVALGLLAALDLHRDPATDRTAQLQLAGLLALAAAAAGLVVLAVVAAAPLQLAFPLLRAVLDAIGHIVAFFVTHLSNGRAPKLFQKFYFPTVRHLRTHLHHQPPPPWWFYVAAALVVAAGLATALVALARVAKPVRRAAGGDGRVKQVEREWLDPRGVHHLYGPRVALTRRVVQILMRRAERRQRGPAPGETVREWLGRLYGAPAGDTAALYEEVRYGGVSDDAARARALQQAVRLDPDGERDRRKTFR